MFETSLWIPWGQWAFLPPQIGEYPLLALFVLLILILLVRSRRDFAELTWRKLLLFVGLIFTSAFVNNLLVMRFPGLNLLPPPNIPAEPSYPFASLLASVGIAVAGAWLGAGPALLVGLAVGVARGLVVSSGLLDPCYFALYGYLAGSFLRQSYRGLVSAIVRQPIAGLPLAAILSLPLQFVSVFAHTFESGLAGLDYAATMLQANFGPLLLQSVCSAILLSVVYLFFPSIRPARALDGFPPYSRSLYRRLLWVVMPLIVLMIVVFVYAVTRTTLKVATEITVNEMARDARAAVDGITYFVQTGQGLLTVFASDEALLAGNGAGDVEGDLQSDLRAVPFFSQLVLFDPRGQPVAMYPPALIAGDVPTPDETTLLARVLQTGATQISPVHRTAQGDVIVSFLVPVRGQNGDERGALLGRTRLDVNPVSAQILASLQVARTQGDGFVVDADGRIVMHAQADMLLTEWRLADELPAMATTLGGTAYETRNSISNTRELVFRLPSTDYPWSVVVRLPYQVVLQEATRIATPLMVVQVLVGGALVILIPLVTGRLTKPLKQMAAGAGRIAEGDLSQPVRMPGDDEVARMGDAFERMRVRLKHRLDDLALLLQVSQSVSATLDLPKGVSTILEGALRASTARVARMILLDGNGQLQAVMARGSPREGLGSLDQAFVSAARDSDQPVTIESLEHAVDVLDEGVPRGPIQSAMAVPVRTKGQPTAVMWLGYDETRTFDESEVTLLSTLAGQAAVLVENARLFQAAESGRGRLAAILDSTSDAVIVSDQGERVLLVNPAAEQAFGITAATTVGQRVDALGLDGVLRDVFLEPLPSESALTKEVPLPDGRTLLASVSAITTADGERLGRVATMRDITHFKQLDEMKSEFVSTVSHDLRAPLTFVRGYAAMMPMVGDINERQQEYLEKILHGVEQMTGLIGDLLDLGRIEAGIGLESEPCHLGAILVEAVDGMRGRAATRGLTLRLEPAERMAMVAGDAALIRQAVSNLVDNAIKYTPDGGMVTVGMSVQGDQVVVRVTDTGIGIAPEDRTRLFEKFYRIRRRDTMHIPGTGLGLAIVKSIVERHSGRVWLESELGRGSTFFMSLPVSAGLP